MTVDVTNTVDICAFDHEAGRVILTIVDHLGWEVDDPEHAWVLQEKINAYFAFVESGQAFEAAPQATRYKVIIEVHFLHPPTPLIKRLILAAATTANTQGWEVRPVVVEPSAPDA